MEKRKRVFSFFADFIPYYRQLPKVTGSVASAILAARMEIQFEKQPGGFYKFLEPAPNNKKYKEGHSWTETLGFSREEFLDAFAKIGVSYKSKTEYEKAEKKFSTILKVPKYTIRKKKDGTLDGRTKTIDENTEKEMYYCRYHDRQTGLTFYLKNNQRSLLKDALSVNPKVRKYRKSEVTEMQKPEDTEIQNTEPSEIQNSEGSELLYNKVSVDTSVDTSVDILPLSAANAAGEGEGLNSPPESQASAINGNENSSGTNGNGSSDHDKPKKSTAEERRKLLAWWNRLGIVTHRNEPKSGKTTFQSAVDSILRTGETLRDICLTIENYRDVLNSPQTRFNYKWGLTDFLVRGYSKFTDRDAAFHNFVNARLNDNGRNGGEPRDRTLEVYESAMRAAKIADSMASNA